MKNRKNLKVYAMKMNKKKIFSKNYKKSQMWILKAQSIFYMLCLVAND